MGVINVTPDSFSDGGDNLSATAALEHAGKLLEAGADILDIGAESTRPGSVPISLNEELDRLMPVFEALTREFPNAAISIDSRKDQVFRHCAELGARWFNRVGALPDDETLRTLAAIKGANIALTHMYRTPETMQRNPLGPTAAIQAVDAYFDDVMTHTHRMGWNRDHIWLDPGIGFGKSTAANLAILGHLHAWSVSNQLMIGVSRKSFIGELFDAPSPKDRDKPSKIIETMCAAAGARLIRTHDVQGLAVIRKKMFDVTTNKNAEEV